MPAPAFAQGELIWEDFFEYGDGSIREVAGTGGWFSGSAEIWTGQGPLRILSGLLAGGATDGTYYDAQNAAFDWGPDIDVVLQDISGKPGTNRQIYVHGRLTPQGYAGSEAGATSYAVNFTTLSGTDRWRLSKQVNGAFTSLGTGGQANVEESAGFGMGLRLLGTTQEIHRQASLAGAWEKLLEAGDAAIATGVFGGNPIGIECNGSAFRAGRVAVYSVSDGGDVETQGATVAVGAVTGVSSVFFSAALTSVAVLGHTSAILGVVATQGTVTSVAVVSAVSDTTSPIGDATSRGVITGLSALVGDQEIVSAGQVVSTAVVTTAGVIVTTGLVVSTTVLSAVNGTPGTIATQGLVVTVGEVSGVSSPLGSRETFGSVVSVGVVDGRTSLNPIRTAGAAVSVGVVSGTSTADTGLIASIEATLLLLSASIVAREAAIAAARLTAPRADDARAAFALGAGKRAYRETERALALARRLP